MIDWQCSNKKKVKVAFSSTIPAPFPPKVSSSKVLRDIGLPDITNICVALQSFDFARISALTLCLDQSQENIKGIQTFTRPELSIRLKLVTLSGLRHSDLTGSRGKRLTKEQCYILAVTLT